MRKLFISNSTIKYNLNKTIISFYTYNKEKYYFINNIQKLNYIFNNNNIYNITNTNYIYKYIKNKSFFIINNLNKIIRNKNINLKGLYNFIGLNKFILTSTDKIFKNKNLFLININEKILKEKMKKIFLYKYYVSILYINNYKFNVVNMMGIKNILKNIYGNKIIFNIINLKYFYLNNDIFAEIISRKLRDRNKRILKVIRKAIMSINVFGVHPLFLIKWDKYVDTLYSRIVLSNNKSMKMRFLNEDTSILNNEDTVNIIETEEHNNNYINYIKNKHVIGVRLEGKGRLTKRLTASRSLLKSKYKGGLKNVVSSYQSLSSNVNRNYIKSNIQYVNKNSKTRNGSFGLKS
jgi:hypothetical protein